MPRVSARTEVPMGHRLMFHEGKCKFPHGHNYEVDVSLSGPLNENGMVIDFSELKGQLKSMVKQFDHAMVLFKEDPFVEVLRRLTAGGQFSAVAGDPFEARIPTKVVVIDQHPTAEVLACLWREIMRQRMGTQNLQVTVYETRDCCASAAPDYRTDVAYVVPEIVEVW